MDRQRIDLIGHWDVYRFDTILWDVEKLRYNTCVLRFGSVGVCVSQRIPILHRLEHKFVQKLGTAYSRALGATPEMEVTHENGYG